MIFVPDKRFVQVKGETKTEFNFFLTVDIEINGSASVLQGHVLILLILENLVSGWKSVRTKRAHAEIVSYEDTRGARVISPRGKQFRPRARSRSSLDNSLHCPLRKIREYL